MVYPYPETDESYEDSLEEAGEAEPTRASRRGGRRSLPASMPPRSAYQPPTPTGYVTQQDLKAALETVARQVAAVNGRVDAVSAEQTRHAANLRKESGDRKKHVDALGSAVRQLRDTDGLVPFLTAGQTGGTPSTLQELLPMLLLSNIQIPSSDLGATPAAGGGSSLFGGSGGDSSMMLLLALALSGDLGGRKSG